MTALNDAQALIDWFEHLSPETLDRIPQFYAADAEFKDPFNEVRGTEAIAHIFRHMFAPVDEPRFVVGSRFSGEDGLMLLWDFHFRRRGPLSPQAMTVRGATHLRFDATGKVGPTSRLLGRRRRALRQAAANRGPDARPATPGTGLSPDVLTTGPASL